MSPEEHLRALKAPDRWTGVRLPRAARPRGAVSDRVASFAAAAVALGIAAATATGIGIAFASVPRGGEPVAAGPAPSYGPLAPSDSSTARGHASAVPAECAASELTATLGGSASWGGYRTTQILLREGGVACSLAVEDVALGGRPAVHGGERENGSVTIPEGASELYLRLSSTCGTGVEQPDAEVTLRLDGASRTVGTLEQSGCGDPVVGQFDGGSLIAPDKLAVFAAHPAEFGPRPTPTSTPAPPAPAIACTSRQLGITPGEFGGSTGNWIQPFRFVNAGAPCSLLPSQFRIGAFAARGGNSARLPLQHGQTYLDVFSPEECFTSAGEPVRAVTKTPVPVSLTIAGMTRRIGTFKVPPCSAPFIDPS